MQKFQLCCSSRIIIATIASKSQTSTNTSFKCAHSFSSCQTKARNRKNICSFVKISCCLALRKVYFAFSAVFFFLFHMIFVCTTFWGSECNQTISFILHETCAPRGFMLGPLLVGKLFRVHESIIIKPKPNESPHAETNCYLQFVSLSALDNIYKLWTNANLSFCSQSALTTFLILCFFQNVIQQYSVCLEDGTVKFLRTYL